MARHEHIPNTWISTVNDLSGSIYYAAGQGDLTPRFSFEGHVLECAGIILDCVRIIGAYEADFVRSRFDLFSDWWHIVSKECQERKQNEMSLMTSSWSMLAGDVSGVWTVEEISQRDDESGQQRIGISVEPIKEKKRECRHKKYGTHVDVHRVVTRGRRLIITEDGYMGLAPYYVEEGQKLALLSGCTHPSCCMKMMMVLIALPGAVLCRAGWKGRCWRSMGLPPRKLGKLSKWGAEYVSYKAGEKGTSRERHGKRASFDLQQQTSKM